MKPKRRKTTNTKGTAPRSSGTLASAPAPHNCPIVGIGASAGGLEAFTHFLRQLPADTGFGFVLVQHLDPLHESSLAQLLARATSMPVREVTNNQRVEANHVYIIPPNTSLGIARGTLRLSARSRNRVAPRSIDFFFEALAKDQGERAVGVILSGNATDGTLGLEAIKAEGGFTFAQDGTARYDSMPRSAVDAGCVDLILSPGNIAKELGRIAKHPYVAVRGARPSAVSDGKGKLGVAGSETGPKGESEKDSHSEILRLLRNHSQVDFSLYKSSTVQRRIARRTVISQRSTLKNYAQFLRGNPKELDALFSDTLISVTSFFRNADAFSVLKEKVFPKLLQGEESEAVRVWVLGCSTGQEAYSIAMAFQEAAEKAASARVLQVFATDLNEANLEKARNGFYAATAVQDVSAERLKRFFVEEESGYRVSKQLRESVVFARQNVINDPPFSRMDLISCRNLMIYLEPSLQRKVIPTFHYALKRGGYLFLGASESVGGFGELFAPLDKKQKIFVKKAAPTLAFHLPVRTDSGGRPSAVRVRPSSLGSKLPWVAQDAHRSELSAEREADRVTMSQFAPPGVLINADLLILQFRGATGAYLEAPTGKASFDLLRMAHEGLMLPLRSAIDGAATENKAVRREYVAVRHNGRTRMVNVEVVPLKNLKERCFLVLFEDSVKAGEDQPSQPSGDPIAGGDAQNGLARGDDSSRIDTLERELSEARDYLQSVQEQQEGANEELQASNEEGQSANEELQSLNEELETSKEELESTNEELTTVNEEMVSRNNELNRLMTVRKENEASLRASEERFRALFNLGPVGVYSCDSAGRIQEFNRSAAEMWGRKPKTGDAAEKYCGSLRMYRADGTPMPHARCPMADVLLGKIAAARDLEVVIERPNGTRVTALANIVPLKNDRGETTGAINCFYDITDRKLADVALHEAQVQLSGHADKLENLVLLRTKELTLSNKQLQSSIESIRSGKEEYQVLFAKSLVMQDKLRHMTRLIITAQEEERKILSRELHDEVVQTLIGINVELTALEKVDHVSGAEMRRKINNIQRLVEGSVDAVHRFARGLRPAALDDLGLIPAIHAFCKSVNSKKNLRIQMTAFGGVEALNSAGRTVLFRVAQEALTNVVRHAQATRVRVNLCKAGSMVMMEIGDDGRSFPVEKTLNGKNPKRLGLIGMKERLEMIGGSLVIESARGRGTTVRAEIPFTVEDPVK